MERSVGRYLPMAAKEKAEYEARRREWEKALGEGKPSEDLWPCHQERVQVIC
jgi:hypothetical protein